MHSDVRTPSAYNGLKTPVILFFIISTYIKPTVRYSVAVVAVVASVALCLRAFVLAGAHFSHDLLLQVFPYLATWKLRDVKMTHKYLQARASAILDTNG